MGQAKLLLILIVAGALFVLTGVRHTGAQLSCDDPFAGVERLRFSPDYWDLTDFCIHSVPFEDIRSGGPPPDGIPPIDDPQFESIQAARGWLQDQSPVIVLEINGDARAYPLAILTWHEIANDVVGDVPVAVTFCPLCNSAIVFDRRVGDRVLRFGVSGNLHNSDLIMWDNETQSWWQQLTGEAIVGTLTDTRLVAISSQVAGFHDFAEFYPDGQVLSRETGATRPYGTNPYSGYDSGTDPFLYEGDVDPRLPATARVLGALVNGMPTAYPFTILADLRVINDEVETVPVVAFWQDGVASALDAPTIDQSRDVGTAALYYRIVGENLLTFRLDPDGAIRDVETGSAWNVFGLAVDGPLRGTQLTREVSGPFFWFAWVAFRPETLLFEVN